MFEVKTSSPLDDGWQARDVELYETAGRASDYSGAGQKRREHTWLVGSFQEALALRAKLEAVDRVTATVRER